ncbi:MAG: DNA gyrase/topoisomerase IV subunit A [Bacteroidales bacterium]
MSVMDENDIPDNEAAEQPVTPELEGGELHHTLHLSGMYENWFLDYASYVILERAVPDIIDGLKPVQRRILHSMYELDDGRFNKVANIVGHTMKYHPHGDASIGDALVQLGQKELLIDMQGNWGNIHTGDSAAAPRYIEARLSKFALEVMFNPKTTRWKASYDGRNKEPITLPAKFPLLLAQGVEGIAVGLASKILPHNFIELIDASIKILKGEDFELLPDFITAGLADFSKYNDGLRGGKVRVRARINQIDKKTLTITELPFGCTTGSLIDTIIAANEKGKIKIRKIDDNTARNVEILIHLMPGVSPDTTIDALFAFTDCEISISPNSCVIDNGRPRFIGVKEMLRISTQNTVDLLRRELEIRLKELMEQLLFSSLEKIFIENRIYRDIEECKTWEEVLEAIDKGLTPYKPQFYREIIIDDILRLTEIRIKRISKFNSFKADELMRNIEGEIDEVKNHLEHLIDYAIYYFQNIRKKYGKDRERKTEIRNFDNIEATMVAAATLKLYVNRAEGFAGTSLKKDEYVGDCSDIDDIIVFREDGSCIITRVVEKVFIGENVVHIDVFKRNDERTIYNMAYQDGRSGAAYVKRFAVMGITRDKEYVLTKGKPGSKVLYFTANPNGESEVVKVFLKPKPKLKKLVFDFEFGSLAIKGRSSQGNILSKNPVRKIVQEEKGLSTLGARSIWYDDSVKRLNADQRGKLLGEFKEDDKILTVMASGHYKLMNFDLSNHFDEDMLLIEKFNPLKAVSVVYYHGEKSTYYLKRFFVEVTDKKTDFVGDVAGSILVRVTTDYLPLLLIRFDEKLNKKPMEDEEVNVQEFIDVKSYRAKGKRLSNYAIKHVDLLEPLPYDEPEVELVVEEQEQEDPQESIEQDNREEVSEETQLSETADDFPKTDKSSGDDNDAIQMTLEF